MAQGGLTQPDVAVVTNSGQKTIVRKEKTVPVFLLFFYGIVTFFYIYQVSFAFLGVPPVFHSQRIAAAILVFCGFVAVVFRNKKKHNNAGIRKNKSYPLNNNDCVNGRQKKEYLSEKKRKHARVVYKKIVQTYIILCIFLIVFSYLQLVVIGKEYGFHLFDAMLNIALFGIPIYWAHTKIYRNLDSFMYVLVFVTAIQTVFIILCLYNDSFAAIIDLTLNYSDEENAAHIQHLRTGYAVGAGCFAAPGAIRYSLGLLAVSYLYVKKRKWVFLLVFAIFSIVSSMVARTGLLFVFVCIVYILKQGKSIKKALSFIIPGVVVVLLAFVYISSHSDKGFLDDRYKRYVALKEDGVNESFFNSYFHDKDTYYPKLSIDTFFGTGMLNGKSGKGDLVHVDGGPLGVYSAMGLLLTIVFYSIIISILFKSSGQVYKTTRQYFLFAFTILLLLGDFKEPSFLTIWPMPFFLTFAYLGLKDGDNKYIRVKYFLND